MSMTVEVPEPLAERVARVAAATGKTPDEIVADTLAAHLAEPGPDDALEAFIGVGASGRREAFDIHEERGRLAATKPVDSI